VPQPILELKGVTVRFGALRAVDDVTLLVDPGERRAVIGPNGAGKTTLFNAITGVIRPTQGRVLLDGCDITRAAPHVRARRGVGRTFQITNLFPNLSVEDNLRLAIRGLSPRKYSLFGDSGFDADERQRADEALDLSRLAHRRYAPVKELSYGEQRQLELAMALTTRPRLLLLDEPAAGLSPAERVIIAETIRGLPRGLTMVLIEHDMDLALGLVDRVTCLHNGRILVEQTPDEIRANETVQEVYLGKPHHA
jgi:branched-chain amino acid transport system ATP-binding protein